MNQIKLDVYYSDYSEPTPKINIFDVEEMMRDLENMSMLLILNVLMIFFIKNIQVKI